MRELGDGLYSCCSTSELLSCMAVHECMAVHACMLRCSVTICPRACSSAGARHCRFASVPTTAMERHCTYIVHTSYIFCVSTATKPRMLCLEPCPEPHPFSRVSPTYPTHWRKLRGCATGQCSAARTCMCRHACTAVCSSPRGCFSRCESRQARLHNQCASTTLRYLSFEQSAVALSQAQNQNRLPATEWPE